MINIRKLTKKDWLHYKKLRLHATKNDPKSFGNSFEQEKQKTDTDWQERVAKSLNKHDTLLVAFDEQEPVGIIGSYYHAADHIEHISHIYFMYVEPAYRKQGLGKALMAHMLDRLRRDNRTKKIRLYVIEGNEAAQKLYESFGFTVTTKLKDEMFVDGVFYNSQIMELFI